MLRKILVVICLFASFNSFANFGMSNDSPDLRLVEMQVDANDRVIDRNSLIIVGKLKIAYSNAALKQITESPDQFDDLFRFLVVNKVLSEYIEDISIGRTSAEELEQDLIDRLNSYFNEYISTDDVIWHIHSSLDEQNMESDIANPVDETSYDEPMLIEQAQ